MPRDMLAEPAFVETAPQKKLSAREQYDAATTLHELLGLALDDMESLISKPDFSVDMSSWVAPRHNSKRGDYCTVCLGGAVLLQRYEAEPDTGRLVYAPTRALLMDDLRQGRIAEAWGLLHNELYRAPQSAFALDGKWQPVLGTIASRPRMSDARARDFVVLMRDLQKDLREAGL